MSLTQLLFGFDGRIRRTHYWLASIGAGFALGVILVVLMIIFGGAIAVLFNAAGGGNSGRAAGAGVIIIALLVFLAWFAVVMWISVALQVKRWHDRDKAWPWVFISFIPIVGAFWVLIECGFLDGTMGPNRFGPSPKGVTGPPQMAPVIAPPPA